MCDTKGAVGARGGLGGLVWARAAVGSRGALWGGHGAQGSRLLACGRGRGLASRENSCRELRRNDQASKFQK